MVGKTISHYKILEKLGEGGMGVVYKAHDTRLDRVVALKFLPHYITSDPTEKERFYHEARAASALMHGNVAVVFEINEHEGQVFIAMECVEGRTLRQVIAEDTLALKNILDIAIQVADGLAAAHEKGIVHRDIKSENIMVTAKGQPKITDFGLAKVKGATKLTKEGSTLGTAAYMSPEQARGEEVDQRSDLFSFGVVLYEMLTGRLPFGGEHQAALLYSIMNDEPQPIARFNEKATPEIEHIVAKALEKDRDDRYQHADDMLADLRRERKKIDYVKTGQASTAPIVKERAARGTGQPPAPSRRRAIGIWLPAALVGVVGIAAAGYFLVSGGRESKKPPAPAAASQFAAPAWRDSIAVLPFKDYSAAKDQEYFCDGMTEDIITKLSSIHDLKVISRTSTMRYRDTGKSMREIARELGVGVILEGSIQKENDEIRVNVQLIRAADDAHLWAEKYDRRLERVFQVQDEISMAIVEALDLKLTSQEERGIAKQPIDNVAAYDYYLKAYHQINRFDERSIDRALQNLQDGIAIIGENAFLYAGMAFAYYQYVNIGVRQEEYIEKSEMFARKALALDPECAPAYQMLGRIISAFQGNQQEAVRQYKKALSINPNDPILLRSLAIQYLFAGKRSMVAPLVERARQIDPLTAAHASIQFDIYLSDGEYDLLLAFTERWYESDPESPMAQAAYALALEYKGRFEESLGIIDRLAETSPDNVVTKFALLGKYGMLKDREKAFQILTPDFQKTCRRDYQWSYSVAEGLAAAGAKKEALDWLENAINRGFLNYESMERDVLLDNIRGEEEFKKLIRRAKYLSDNFEV